MISSNQFPNKSNQKHFNSNFLLNTAMTEGTPKIKVGNVPNIRNVNTELDPNLSIINFEGNDSSKQKIIGNMSSHIGKLRWNYNLQEKMCLTLNQLRNLNKGKPQYSSIFPTKLISHTSKIMTMRPLHTRKNIEKQPSFFSDACLTQSCNREKSDSPINPLTQRIQISSCRNKNHRKQTLEEVLDFKDLTFEFENNRCTFSKEHCDSNNDYYSYTLDVAYFEELQLPDVDEFSKFKKTDSTMLSMNIQEPDSAVEFIDIHECPRQALPDNQTSIQESPISFEQKLVPNLSLQKSIFSDSSDSEDEGGTDDDQKTQNVECNKSLICKECKKYFKTTRSLKIHVKRIHLKNTLNDGIQEDNFKTMKSINKDICRKRGPITRSRVKRHNGKHSFIKKRFISGHI